MNDTSTNTKGDWPEYLLVAVILGILTAPIWIPLSGNGEPKANGSPTAMERADQNIKVLTEAQTKCAQIHGTLRATMVNRMSYDRKLVCDVSPNLSLDMGVITN